MTTGPATSLVVHDVRTPRVVFGDGALTCVAAEVERLGATRALLIATHSAAESAKTVSQSLRDALVAHIEKVALHVPIELADSSTQLATDSEADLIVTLGGGSAIGLGKAIAQRTGLPILAIPTTYAGSEMTSIWGQTSDGSKATARDPRVLPRTVIYDPLLTIKFPPKQAAASGMNAAAHCIEALYAPRVSAPTFRLAEDGLRLLSDALPQIVASPTDGEARSKALTGAWFAGCALGATQMGLHHTLCHVLGGSYDLPHSAVHSAVLPYVTAWNTPSATAAMNQAAEAIGSATAAAGLWELASRIGAPASLLDVGFDVHVVDEVAARFAAASITNPRPVSPYGVRSILLASCEGTLAALEALTAETSTR